MEKNEKKYPIGIQNFESLRNDGYFYVDKTRHVYDFVNTGRYYFLSRPRRFGKSLFLSTLQAYFEGKKELFEGTYIATQEKEWIEYPILKLDLNAENYEAAPAEILSQRIDATLKEWEQDYPTGFETYSFGVRFEQIIKVAYKKHGRGVVILIDEYDKPLLQAIGKKEEQDAIRGILKGFYGVLKSMDQYIKFAFLTGVTKFGKVSVFSDLNNLNDISADAKCWDICGITEEELKTHFKYDIEMLATANKISVEECFNTLKRKYDGYHFEETAPGVYNPFSILKAFTKKKFGSYWFETGTPTYLVNLLQYHDWKLAQLEFTNISEEELNSIDSESSNPIPVIYQSGYLTIKNYDSRFNTYKLGFPNEEVEIGFIKYLAPFYLYKKNKRTGFDISGFVEDVESGKAEQFCKRLKTLFADTPYELVKDLENHYQNIVWVVFKLMGFYTQPEYHTSDGRIDLLIKTPQYIYVMEFKLDGSAEEAMEQIKSKEYPLPFEMDGRKVFRIGMNFSDETRNVEKYIIEEA